MVRVRDERRLVHNGCKSYPGTGSFRPVAIGAAVEVTKLLKAQMEEGREGDSASVQAETRVNAEKASKFMMQVPSRH
jgi:hypothetical protein